MDKIEIQTLIDISLTNVIRGNQGSQLEIDQHRNFITLRQCLEIRSIIEYSDSPLVSTENIKGLGFGSKYKGLQAVWSFKFSPDRIGVYGKELEFLINDLDQIPIIKNLRETINIQKAIFELTDAEYKNTIIKAY